MAFITLDLSREAPEIFDAASRLRDVSLDAVRLDQDRLAELRSELLDPYLSGQQMDVLERIPRNEMVVITGFDLSRYNLPETPQSDARLPTLPPEIPLVFVALTIPSGLVVTQNYKELIGTTLQHVYPEPGRENDHSSRGIYDLSEHTDEPIFAKPAVFTALDCLYGDPKGATGMIALPAILRRLDVDTIATLTEPVFTFESGKTYKKHEFFDDSILKEDPSKESGYRIKFHNNSRTTSTSEAGKKALEALRRAVAETREAEGFEHTLAQGHKLFITNEHGLHYRKPLTGAAEGEAPAEHRRWCLRLRANTQQYEAEIGEDHALAGAPAQSRGVA